MDNIKKPSDNMKKVMICIAVIAIMYFLYNKTKQNKKPEQMTPQCDCSRPINPSSCNCGAQQSNQQSKYKLYFYYMDGCGFCKEFKPEWEKLNQVVSNSQNLKNQLELVDINCRLNGQRCNSDNIGGYPMIILKKPNGTKATYNAYPRTAESVLQFIKANFN